ncbi:MAG: flagellar biosynthetic protein FliO [Planctomycetota bacterium]
MPTRLALALAFAAIAFASTAHAADLAVRGDTVSANALRFRPGATSAGPRGLPRAGTPSRVTLSRVTPASFEPVASQAASIEAIATEVVATGVVETETTVTLAEPAPFVAPGEPVALAAAELASEPDDTPAATVPAPEPEASASASADDRRRVGGGNPRPAVGDSASPQGDTLAGVTDWRPSTETLTATGGGLAACLGLIVVALCVVRSFLPKASRPLPRDVVEVLGRTTLGGRRTAQLVRVGAKLVLVSTTPDGAETLTEVTDPDEVARLVALCDAASGSGAEATFQQLFQQMASEPAEAGFLGGADRESPRAQAPASLFSDGYDPRSLAAAYANTPGGRDAA